MKKSCQILIIVLLAFLTGCSANRRYPAEELGEISVTNLTEVVQQTRVSGFAVDTNAPEVKELGLEGSIDSMPADPKRPILLKTKMDLTRFDAEQQSLYAVLDDDREVAVPISDIRYLEVSRYDPGRKLVSPNDYLREALASTSKPIPQIVDNNNPFWQKTDLKAGHGVFDPKEGVVTVLTSKGMNLKLDVNEIEYVMVKERSYIKTARVIIALAGLTFLGIDAGSIFN